MDCAIPLTTKYWEIDYGTLKSTPDSGFIENSLVDSDGSFIFYCESKNGNYCFGLRNSPKEFDYTITIFVRRVETNLHILGLNNDKKLELNSPFSVSIDNLFDEKNMELYFIDQKLKIAYNFFIYQNLEIHDRQRMRYFVRQKYEYSGTAMPLSIQKSETSIKNPVLEDSMITKLLELKYYSNIKFLDLKDISPYNCDVFFYVNSLDPFSSTKTKSSTIITPKDMIKIAVLPDGTSAAICQMEYFMESSPEKFKFDDEGLELHEAFKSIEEHQICSSCPNDFEVRSCNIWQMNVNGYYLCTICCLGFGKLNSMKHRCRVAKASIKKFRSIKSRGYCQHCLFYFKYPIQFKDNAKDKCCDRYKHIYYTETEFFQILASNDPKYELPDYSDLQTKKDKCDDAIAGPENKISKKSNEISIEKDAVDDLQEAFADIVTIKDGPIISANDEFPAEKNEETELLKMDDVSEKEDSENEGWETADENVSEEDFGNEAFIV